MSAYRVAAVVVTEPEVAWATKPKEAFARGEKRYARRMLVPFLVSLAVIIAGVALMFTSLRWLGMFLFFGGLFAMTVTSKSGRFHDPTMAVHDHAQDDLVAWGERVAEAEGPRMLGSAIAGVIFGSAAQREGANRTALQYYEAALDDVTQLHPEALVREVATIAAVRGGSIAVELGERERANALLAKRKQLFEKKVPDALMHLPSIMTCKPFAALAADLDEEEERLYASLA